MDRALAKRASAWLAAVILAGLAGGIHAQGAKPDAAKGQVIAAQTCAACHAADGNSVAPANPKLAGQFPEYVHKQLVNFKPHSGK